MPCFYDEMSNSPLLIVEKYIFYFSDFPVACRERFMRASPLTLFFAAR
jgi:hypothetical protein